MPHAEKSANAATVVATVFADAAVWLVICIIIANNTKKSRTICYWRD